MPERIVTATTPGPVVADLVSDNVDVDIESEPPVLTYCSALRITPYGRRGPDHAQAVTHRFAEPVTLTDTQRYRRAEWTQQPQGRIPIISVPELVPRLLTVSTPFGHPQWQDLAKAALLWWARPGYAAFEIWSQTPTSGLWQYQLYPRVEGGDPRAVRPPKGMHVQLAGHAHAADERHGWPSPHGDEFVHAGVQLRQAVTDVRPPPAGPARRPATTEETST